MSTDDSTIRLIKTAAAICLILFAGWLIAPTLSGWQGDRLANQIAQRVADAKDARVKVPLRQLADLGDLAIEPLVVAATSERAAVATIARQILNEKLAAWEWSPETSATATATDTLATALATHIEEFGPAGKQWAERLALTIIERTDRLPAEQTQNLLEHCNQVLAAVPPRGPRLRTLTTRTEADAPPAAPRFLPLEPSFDPLTHASEAALDRTPIMTREQMIQEQLPRRRREAEGVSFRPLATGLKWASRQRGDVRSEVQGEVRNEIRNEIRNERIALPPAQISQTLEILSEPTASAGSKVVDVPAPREMAVRAAALRQLSSQTLLQHLGKADFYETGIIRSLLLGRGFAEGELALRQQLVSSEVADRLRLVDKVSQLPAAKARSILRWLLGDKSGDVRLRALTALATTNSPDLSKLARELAANDEDPRVAKLASRLLRQVR